jgi:protein-S-isoprenylcysteine O-methyltransferase Ste14
VRHTSRYNGKRGRRTTLSTSPSVLQRPLTRLWRLLVSTQREIERTPWGGFLLGNVWPAYVFALPLAARTLNFTRASPGATLHQQAQYVQELLTLAFLALVVLLFVIRRKPIAGDHAPWRPAVVALAGTFLLNVVAYIPIDDTTSTAALLASSTVIVAGTLFTIWSLATLGRCFGLFPEVRGLVLSGPYQLVRHPVYLGEMLSAFGLLLAKPHPLIILIFVAFALLQFWRTVFEERALRAAFPDVYPDYARRVPRLIPFVHP